MLNLTLHATKMMEVCVCFQCEVSGAKNEFSSSNVCTLYRHTQAGTKFEELFFLVSI